jgi:hypothetical protein
MKLNRENLDKLIDYHKSLSVDLVDNIGKIDNVILFPNIENRMIERVNIHHQFVEMLKLVKLKK